MHPGETMPTLHGPYWDLKRATDIADMLSLYTGRMPRPLNITYIIDDNPAVMLPYSQRERMVELGEQGECASPHLSLSLSLLHVDVLLQKVGRLTLSPPPSVAHVPLSLPLARPQTTALPSSSRARTRACPTLRKPVRPTRRCGAPSAASTRPTTRATACARSCGTTPRRPTCACTLRRASCTATRCSRASRSARSCPCLRSQRPSCTRTSSRRRSSSGRRTMSGTSRPGRARA